MTEFPIPSDSKILGIFEKQWIHFLLIIASFVLFYYISTIPDVLSGNDVLGFNIEQLYWIAFFIPIIHQIIVWFCWRIQLYYNGMNKVFGRLGFGIYAVLFSIFFIYRFISILMLSIASENSLEEFKIYFWILLLIILFPVIYLFYSVKHYFGIVRAFGIDHFDPEYHEKPLEKRGIFKYTNNGMYIFGLLVFYLPGFFYASLAGILLAIFNHTFIWVHFYTVEKTDMQKIYP